MPIKKLKVLNYICWKLEEIAFAFAVVTLLGCLLIHVDMLVICYCVSILIWAVLAMLGTVLDSVTLKLELHVLDNISKWIKDIRSKC